MGALGSLERIDFLGFGIGHRFHMGGQIAIPVFPFCVRFRAGGAVPLGRVFGFAVATVALFNDLMAFSAVVGATGSRHEMAFLTFSDSCTKQLYHLLLNSIKTKKKAWENPRPL